MKPTILGVIPSRYSSSRLPAKPLAMILGKPMVQWVYEAAKKAISKVVVATDDERIKRAVLNFGGDVLMTPRSCSSGTERMAAVSKVIKADYYVNIQGDEPMIHPSTIRSAIQMSLKTKGVATAATRLKPKEFPNPSSVKVIVGSNNQAIYFSRAPIPFKAHGVQKHFIPYKHLGLYVYPRLILQQFVKWRPTDLEKTEKLEQLRALYYGCPIFVAFTPHDSVGVDTPGDLKAVRKILTKLRNGR